MLRKLTLISFVMLSSFISKAQSPLDEEGNQFSLASGYTTAGIPVYLSYEMGVTPDMTFGIESSYRIFNESVDTGNFNHSIMGLSFFGNYYFNTLLNMDQDMGLYAGLNLAYYKYFSPEGYFDKGESSAVFSAGAQIGFRYYFSDFGLYLEGIGTMDHFGGKFGLTYRLPY